MIVVESVVANSLDKLQVSRSSAMLEHRDQLIPVKDLGAMLGQRQASVPEDKQPLVVLQSQGRRVAVSVDHVVGDRDLVIRPLPEELRSIGAYQGAATLARGESMLVLRPDWLAEEQAQSEQQSARRALVVDDSITARAMHRTMLESGGFVVHAASSGEQALEKVRFSPYEIVVCDLHMEGMDGIALIREMRSWSNTQHVPIILVSVTDDESVRNRATEAGADAFMTKKDCASGRLLSEVETVIARRKSA
jgi:CheY-like chemotaxis protein